MTEIALLNCKGKPDTKRIEREKKKRDKTLKQISEANTYLNVQRKKRNEEALD